MTQETKKDIETKYEITADLASKITSQLKADVMASLDNSELHTKIYEAIAYSNLLTPENRNFEDVIDDQDGKLNLEAIRKGFTAYFGTRLKENFWRDKRGKTLHEIFPSIEKLFYSKNIKDKVLGALTAQVLKNQVNHIEYAIQSYGEVVVISNLGYLSTNVLEVVKEVMLSKTLSYMTDVQVLDGPRGDIFTMNPRYTSDEVDGKIRGIEILLDLNPAYVKEYFTTATYSVDVGLAQQASYINGTLERVKKFAIENLRKTRDLEVINKIFDVAEPVSNLDFKPVATTCKDEDAKIQQWKTFDSIIQQAKSYVYNKNGRGTVSFIVCGINASNIIASSDKFVGEYDNNCGPINSFKTGTYDGNIDVIVDNHIDTDKYAFGFKGMQTGDAGIIFADYVPIYIRIDFAKSSGDERQGITSYFDAAVVNERYFVQGKLLRG